MALMAGWKFFTRNGGEAKNGRDGKFFVSLHSWQRGSNPPFLWRPLYIAYLPLLFQILSNPFSPTSLSSPTSTATVLSVVLFLWLNGWSRHIRCAILLNDNIDLFMSSLGTLVPEGPGYVFYATRRQVYRGLTHNVVFTGTLIWYHKHRITHSTLRAQ